MLSFKEYTDEFLLEVLDSEFEVHHDENLKNHINSQLKDKVAGGHTAVMSSDHMDKHGIQVLRMKNQDNHIEYHILNDNGHFGELPKEQQNQKSVLHALKIIKDDSKYYLDRGNKIKLQAHDNDQHKVYKKLARHLIKNHPDKIVKDVGEQERTDGEGLAKTLVIETKGFNAINWHKFLKESGYKR